MLETRGKWGGIIILGKAPTSAASYTSNFVEGISGKPYGGTDPTDSSGLLRYVRVWHGGAVVGADNEINGITFGGVGSGTTVEYCEVAYNADDGFECARARCARTGAVEGGGAVLCVFFAHARCCVRVRSLSFSPLSPFEGFSAAR